MNGVRYHSAYWFNLNDTALCKKIVGSGRRNMMSSGKKAFLKDYFVTCTLNFCCLPQNHHKHKWNTCNLDTLRILQTTVLCQIVCVNTALSLERCSRGAPCASSCEGKCPLEPCTQTHGSCYWRRKAKPSVIVLCQHFIDLVCKYCIARVPLCCFWSL